MKSLLKNFGKNDWAYIVLSIVNMYIIPMIFMWNYPKDTIQYLNYYEIYADLGELPRLWFCGIGGILQVILIAIYEKSKEVKNDKALWLTLVLLIPNFITGIVWIIDDPQNYNSQTGITMLYTAPMLAETGMWIGRENKKRFYKADINFIAGSIILSAAFCIMAIMREPYYSLNNALFIYIPLAFLVLCVLYGRFSEFEYIAGRLARAMAVGFIVFMPCGIEWYISEFIIRRTSERFKSPFTVGVTDIVLFSALSAAFAVSVALVGVLVGYYLRIMKFGGENKPEKLSVKKILVSIVITAIIISLLITYSENRYWFYRKNANIWDIVNVSEDDIYMIRVGNDMYDVYDDSVITKDRTAIHKIVEVLKNERGIKNERLYSYDGYAELFYVNAYDKDYNKLFSVVTGSNRGYYFLSWNGQKETSILGDGYKCTTYDLKDDCTLLIPAQYYGKEATKESVLRMIAGEEK